MKIGIVGMGSIGSRHAKNLKAMGHEVHGFDPKCTSSTIARLHPNEGELLAAVDALVVASDSNTHAWYILTNSVKKNLFVEKPIGVSTDDMIEIRAAAKAGAKAGNVLMVGYNLRFHSCVKQAREWVKLIGHPLFANFTLGQFSEKPVYLRDGVILNWSHEIDLALYLLGEANVVASSTRLTDGKDDLTDILLKHDNGCHSTVHLDYLTNPEIRQFIIVGDAATIIVDLVNRHAWLRDEKGIVDQFEGDDDWNDNYIEEMRAFIDLAQGNFTNGKEYIGCTADEALDVLEICLKVKENAGPQ